MNSQAFLTSHINKINRVLLQDLFDSDISKMFVGMELYNGHSIAENIDDKKLEEYINKLRQLQHRKEEDLAWIEHPFTEKYPLTSFEKVVRAVKFNPYDDEDF